MSAPLTILLAELQLPEPGRRVAAAQQLARLRSEAQRGAIALVRASGDECEEVRQWVGSALEDLGPPQVEDVPLLGEFLTHENGDVGYWAATLIGRCGAEGSAGVPQLTAALRSPTAATAVRERAAWALGEIGPAAAPALDALHTVAASTDGRLARLAEAAIEKIDAE